MKDGGHMDDLRLVSPPKPAKVDPDEVDNIGTLVLALGIPPPKRTEGGTRLADEGLLSDPMLECLRVGKEPTDRHVAGER